MTSRSERKLGDPPLELVEWDRAGAVDVAGREFLHGSDVDEHHVASSEPLDELVAIDRLDRVAEIVVGRALNLREPCGGHVSQREPQAERLGSNGIADPVAVSLALHEAGGMKRLEVLRRIRGRLAAGAGELLHRPWRLGE